MSTHRFDAGDKVIVTTVRGRRIPGTVISRVEGNRERYRVDIAPEGKPAVGLHCEATQLELVEAFE